MIYNEQNPYVYNAHLYANSPEGHTYESTNFYLVHKSVNWMAFGSGLLSCSMSIYLILCRTPDHFKQFSRVLLLCACSDVVYLFWGFFCQTRINNSDGTMLISLTGPFQYLPYFGQCTAIVVQSVVMLLSYVILPIQYHFRYAILKNNRISVCSLLLFYLTLAVVLSIGHGYMSYQAYCTYDNPTKIDYATFWYHEVPVPQLIVAPQSYFPSFVQNLFYGFSMIVSYLAILFFARLTYKELKLNADRLSSKTLKMQKQFSRALCIQSIVPLVLVVAPITVSIVEIVFKARMSYSGEFAMLSTAFFPLLNSMSTLMFISSYRHQCAQLLLPCYQDRIEWPHSSGRPQIESTKTENSTYRAKIVPVERP